MKVCYEMLFKFPELTSDRVLASNPRTLLRLLSAEFWPTDCSVVGPDCVIETGAFNKDVPANLDKVPNETGVSPKTENFEIGQILKILYVCVCNVYYVTSNNLDDFHSHIRPK